MEAEVRTGVAADPPAALVDQAMVRVAQKHQVVDVRGAPIGPVHEMVGVQPSIPLASGEPARAVAMTQNPEELPGYGPASPADPDRPATPLEDPLDPAVAGQSPNALRCQSLPTVGFREPRRAVALLPGQDLGPGVDHDRRRWSMLRVAAGHKLDEGVGHPGVLRAARRRLIQHDLPGPPLQGRFDRRSLFRSEHPLDVQSGDLMVPVEPEVPPPVHLPDVLGSDPLVPPGLAVQGRGAHLGRCLGPPGVRLGRPEPRQGPELVPGDPRLRVRLRDPREPPEGMGDPDSLAGRSPRDPVPPGQP
jgi:hypothetical protein